MIKRVRSVSRDLAQKRGGEPTLEDTAVAVRLPIHKVHTLMHLDRPTTSLDQPVGDPNGSPSVSFSRTTGPSIRNKSWTRCSSKDESPMSWAT